MRHFTLTPRLTGVGKKEQNGSIEASNGALKRQLKQELLLRGSRDFESQAAYAAWLEGVLRKRNRARSTRLADELAVMRPLGVLRLPAYKVVDVRVGPGSTIRAKSCTYSVPSRLIGERVRVHVHEMRLCHRSTRAPRDDSRTHGHELPRGGSQAAQPDDDQEAERRGVGMQQTKCRDFAPMGAKSGP